MSQSDRLIEALKQVLKSKGITYAELAKRVGLSEASVKRIFSEKSFSLDRLESVMDVVDIGFADLVRLAGDGESEDRSVLNEGQEYALAEDMDLLILLYLLLDGKSLAEIVREHGFSAKGLDRELLKLDKLRLIDLYPDNRVKIRVVRWVRWLPSGPLMRKYGKRLREDFFSEPFHGESSLLRFVPARLSRASIERLKARVKKLIQEYEELEEWDRRTGHSQTDEVAIMIAYRPWKTKWLERKQKH